MLAHLRLLQLLSPMLPVGSYSYSQGLEWAVEQQWITTDIQFKAWLDELVRGPLAQQDLPLLRKLHSAVVQGDVREFDHWSHMALAMRDTAELRAEELSRAEAYHRVLIALPDRLEALYLPGVKRTPLAAIAWASAHWAIDENALLSAYAHSWLEAYIINGVKIIPLGQTQGQVILHSMSPSLCRAVETASGFEDSEIGFTSPAVSLASCAHETQYTRIYRS